MPELPEVEHVVRYLRPRLVGRRAGAPAAGVAAGLAAQRRRVVRDVTRRAKRVVVGLDRGALVVHLGLTGELWLRAAAPTARHERLRLVLADGAALVMEDARRLGWARALDGAALARALDALGPEPIRGARRGEAAASGRAPEGRRPLPALPGDGRAQRGPGPGHLHLPDLPAGALTRRRGARRAATLAAESPCAASCCPCRWPWPWP